MEKIKIVYHANIKHIEKIETGDWIDLRSAHTVQLNKGDFAVIDLGVSMQLPEGYEAHIVPRSSTFKNWGIIQTNGVGIIDNSYCGTYDIWGMPVFATRDTKILKGDRICQFRILKKQPDIEFETVGRLEGRERGGFGSTGQK